MDFMSMLETAVNWTNDLIWSSALVYLCLAVGLFFTIATRFHQVRHIKDMAKLTFKSKASSAGISSFQALSLALSGRVGVGNIAGVATAIAFGGPGAVFWMWLIAFLGAGSAFVESTLSQIYKSKQDGQFRGGPAYYIEKGLNIKWFAVLFAIVTVFATGVFLPGVQANSIASAMNNAFGLSSTVVGISLAVLLGLIIFGGLKRIAKAAQILVPFMAIGYILVALIIIAFNITKVPEVFMLIITSAFGIEATFGAILGSAIAWGVKRGIYSNEAGQGTAPHASAAAEVSHPAKQGLVQSFSVYIDTLFICTATAFMILITNSYNVYSGENPDATPLKGFLANVVHGPVYTQNAVETVMPGFGAPFVAIALFFFAFTTLMAYYYMAETNLAYITRKTRKIWLEHILKVAILGVIFYGCVNTADLAWALGDIGVGAMAWLNIIAILLLMKPALAAFKDYEAQKALGQDPVFKPTSIGIKNADFWENEYVYEDEDSQVEKPDDTVKM